jgi:uncharacterized membrane protein YfcA
MAPHAKGMADLPAFWTYVLLVSVGIVIATYGTLIGAGGGILIVPTMLFLDLHEPANTIARGASLLFRVMLKSVVNPPIRSGGLDCSMRLPDNL